MTADCSAAGGAEHSVAGSAESFWGTFLVGPAYCCPSPHHFLPHFLEIGQCGPHEHFSTTCLGITMAWGIAATWVDLLSSQLGQVWGLE